MELVKTVECKVDPKAFDKYDIPKNIIPDESTYISTWKIKDISYFRKKIYYIKTKYLIKDPNDQFVSRSYRIIPD